MKKTLILVMCIATVVACGSLIPDSSSTDLPYNLSWGHKVNVFPVRSSRLFPKWSELLVSLSDGKAIGGVLLIAADDEEGGDEKDDDQKDDEKGDKEKDDEGAGWNRLWDAPKLG